MKAFPYKLTVVAMGVGLLVLGCKEEGAQPPSPPAAAQPNTPIPPQGSVTPHDHAGHDHGGHDHTADDKGIHAGPKHELGSQKVGDATVLVRQVGEVAAGKPATFELVITGAEKPKAVRAWVGVESGDGSVKVRARETAEFYDADLEVPGPLPSGSKLWVEVEGATKTATGGFELK